MQAKRCRRAPQVESAKKAAAKIDSELTNLQATLKDIESARPFEDLTVRLKMHTCGVCAETSIVNRPQTSPRPVPNSQRLSRRWSRTANGPPQATRRSSGISKLCKVLSLRWKHGRQAQAASPGTGEVSACRGFLSNGCSVYRQARRRRRNAFDWLEPALRSRLRYNCRCARSNGLISIDSHTSADTHASHIAIVDVRVLLGRY